MAAVGPAPGPRAACLGLLERGCGWLGAEGSALAEWGVYERALDEAARAGVLCSFEVPQFRAIYAHIARGVVAHMTPGSYMKNAALVARVRAGDVDPADVARMPGPERCPDVWGREQERRRQHDQWLRSGEQPAAITDQFLCETCGRRECTYYEMQTRSCDEPATLFITCTVCGNNWRIG